MAESSRVSRWPLSLAVAAIVSFAAGPGLATVGAIPPLAGFILFALGGLLGLIATVGGLIAAMRGAGGRAAAAIILGALPVLGVVSGAVQGRGFPRINDITTDLADPPGLVHAQELAANRGRDLSYPESFKEIVRSAYPDLKSLQLTEPAEKVFDRALKVAHGMSRWEVTHVDGEKLVFEGIETSRLFRFQDDFVVRVRRDGEASLVDMRSKSRDGQGDLGANAKRIRAFFERLKT